MRANRYIILHINYIFSPFFRPAFQREICIYGIGDLPFLMRSEKFFANKFDAEKDDMIFTRQCDSKLFFDTKLWWPKNFKNRIMGTIYILIFELSYNLPIVSYR